jgi:hypothetical protein
MHSLDNPVTDAVFSVGARVHVPRDPHQGWTRPDDRPTTVTRQEVPPLVTVRPALPDGLRLGRSPYRNQEKLLGAAVYTVPATRLRTGAGAAVPDQDRFDHRLAPGRYTLTARCPAGSEVFLWAPDLFGTARLGAGELVDFRGELPGRRAAMAGLGRTGDGQVTVSLRAARAGTLPHETVGCLDGQRLSAAVERLRSTGAVSVDAGDSGVRAELPAGPGGTAVLAAPRIAGWSCGGRPADSYLGLVATPVAAGQTSVECSFRPPGLRAGLFAAVAGAIGLIVLGPGRPMLSRPRRRGDTKTSSA